MIGRPAGTVVKTLFALGLNYPHFLVRSSATRGLRWMSASKKLIIAEITAALQNANAESRIAAFRLAASLHYEIPDVQKILKEAVNKDTDPAVRNKTLELLKEIQM
jgi:hypothetical protein